MIKFLTLLFFAVTLNGYSQKKEIRTINKDSLEWETQGNVFLEGDHLNKLQVSKRDSMVSLYSDIKRDHRIFGYEKPNLQSEKMILFSVFTFDVKGNPCNCPLGSYYQTAPNDTYQLKYTGKEKSFIKVAVYKDDIKLGAVYFEKKWVEIE